LLFISISILSQNKKPRNPPSHKATEGQVSREICRDSWTTRSPVSNGTGIRTKIMEN